MRRSKGCLWIALGFIGFVIIVLVALFNTGDEDEWCNVGLQAGDCEMYDSGDGEYRDTCFCIDRIQISVDDLDVYHRAQSQCQDLNGTLATSDDPDLLVWLSKRMFFSDVDNAYIGLVKMGSEWLWDKVGGTVRARDLLWRADFPPDKEHHIGVISVETRKVYNDDDNYEQYVSYNYDFYSETDKAYNWYGFSTTDNQQHGAERIHGICHYVERPTVEVFHEEEEKIRDQQACVCNSGYVSLSGLNDSTEFTSPNYPSNYCSDLNCRWIVSADQGYVIKVQWVVFSTENRMDMVFVYDGESDDSPMLSSCTGVHCPDRISSHNWMQIHFRSDHVITGLGFKAILTVIEKDSCYCSADSEIVLDYLEDSRTIKSPRYPSNYCSNLNCKWLVSAPTDLAVQIDWLAFSLEIDMDFVYVRDGHDPNSPIIKECTGVKCGNQRSSGNQIQIHLHTDNVNTDIGFRTRVTAVKADPCYCSESLKIELGNLHESFVIQSPSYPSRYCANHKCQWTIVAPQWYGLHSTFEFFDLEYNYDHVEIYDGGLITDRMFDNCTGRNCPDRITSGNQMHITFRTDPEMQEEGFQGIVTVVQNYCLQTEIAQNRNIAEAEPLIKEIFFSQARDDGFIPVGGNATVICANNSKIQGKNTIIDVVTCESPKWNRDFYICVPACTVEFYVPNDIEIEDRIVCKSADTDDMPFGMFESGETVAMQYDFFGHQPSEMVYTCNGNDWTDKINNYGSTIKCDQGPKILIVGGFYDPSSMELYYPTNPSRNMMLSNETIEGRQFSSSGMISDGSVLTCGGAYWCGEDWCLVVSCERYFPQQNIVLVSEPLNIERIVAASSVLNGVMYICGGDYDHSTCERYIIDVGWELISPTNIICSKKIDEYTEIACTMAAYNGQLIIIGDNEAQAYSPLTDSWSQFPKLNDHRDGAASAVMNGKLFVCGGKSISRCDQYDELNNKWVFVADMNKKRHIFIMVTMGTKIFALGGYYADPGTVEMFNGKEWILLETPLQRRRDGGHTAVFIP